MTKMKTGRTDLHQEVPLIINHDWTLTIAKMKKLLSLKKHSSAEAYGAAKHYQMSSMGTLSEHSDSESWYRFSGNAVNQTMPWIKDLLERMQELQPDDGAISFLNGSAAGHIDLSTTPSALNYIFYSTDPDAHTWLNNGVDVETHSSNVGTAWIIDTQKEHGVANNGVRYSLSIHFKADYQTVKAWFDKQTQSSLTFGI